VSEQHNSVPNLVEERQKQRGLWAAGIFTALCAAFAGISIYAVVQQGRFDFEDTILMPATVILTIGSFLGYFFIRQGRYKTGSELLFIAMMVIPVIGTLVLSNILVIGIAFTVLFALVMYNWILLKTSRRLALATIALVILAFIGIEIWNPGFRGASTVAIGAVPVVTAFAVVVLMAFIVRQTWDKITYSISNRLTALVMILTVPLLIGIAVYISSRAGSEIEAQALQALQKNNQSLATNVSTWLELNALTLQEMTLLPDILGMQADEQRPVLQAVAKTHPYMYLVSTTDLSGLNLARNDDAKLADYSDREWFQNARSGAPITYQSLIGRTTNQPALVVSAPILNPSGSIVGVGMFAADLANLSEQTRVSAIGQTGYIYILDANDLVLAHPDPAYTTGELKNLGEYPPVAAMRQGQAGLIPFTDESGVRWRAYVSKLDNGWGIIAQQPEAELLAPVRQFQTTAGILIFIGSVLMFALVWFAIRRNLQPIGTLTSTVSAIAAGDLSRIAEVKSQDEIGVLASTFNKMTAQLRESFATLEQRVTERTQSLELAAEVGRSVSQVRALDVMLKDAVELIRAQFNLYYTQIYLANPGQTELVLQAGTGSVGLELLGRGHRLPLNTASINGRAAVEKKSMVISDTATSAAFRPNPLLPATRSEMAVPLLIGDRVVGVLDMQSEQAGSLSQDVLSAFEALAGQLAIAIQNATFLAEAEQARAEVEAQARRLAKTGWTDYLDALHKPEKTGFVFENDHILPFEDTEITQPREGVSALAASISVSGETLGELLVDMEEGKQTTQAVELVNIVARQVAQQIESIRLLDSSERYRFEAEQASRRLTREGWQDYTEANVAKGLSYIYDLKEVRPFNQAGDQQAEESALSLPLKVRDETVGKLVIQGLGADDNDARGLANAVAERLGAHIETLRQFDQTQSALAQTEKLSAASLRFAQATDLQELLSVANETLGIQVVNRSLLGVFNYNSANVMEEMVIVANWWNGSGHEPSEIGRRYTLETLNALPFFMSTTPVFSNDTFDDGRIDGASLQLVKQQNIRSMAVLPLFLGSHQIGVLLLESEETHSFSQADTRLFTAMAPQIATVLENRRQFERAQKQAERESTLNLISQKIQSATSVEAVLQIAARELGHALGAPRTIAQLSMKDSK
jgi:GAF domain-containing protein/HAMP domain-containing protein